MASTRTKNRPKGAAEFGRLMNRLTLHEQVEFAKWLRDNKLVDSYIGIGELMLAEANERTAQAEERLIDAFERRLARDGRSMPRPWIRKALLDAAGPRD